MKTPLDAPHHAGPVLGDGGLGVLGVGELHEGDAGGAAVQAGDDVDGVVHQRRDAVSLRQARVVEERDDVVPNAGSPGPARGITLSLGAQAPRGITLSLGGLAVI
jgi:hypothetical protein